MPLLPTLKAETAQQHTALEESLDLFKRAATVAGYRNLIEGFYGIYAPLEEELAKAAQWQALGWDYEARLKTPWLVTDLQATGTGGAGVESLPRCADLPASDSLGAAIGCLYVLEGSTLGGQYISRRLRETLSITPDSGGRFFHGYGEQTAQSWKRFGEWAEELSSRDAAIATAAVPAANATFDCFSRWFRC